MAEEDLPNPSGVLVYFLVISIIYLIYTAIQLFTSDSLTNIIKLNLKINNITIIGVYILLLIVGTYFININISKAMCGSQEIDWLNILFITLLPWLLIFIILYFLLEIFPGWVTPFSNTIGYLAITLLGVKSILNKLLKTKKQQIPGPDSGPELGPDRGPELVKAINNINNNKSKFINQFDVNPHKFINFTNNLIESFIIKDCERIPDDGNTQREGNGKLLMDIYKLVILKHIIGKLCWYILAGVLISSITYSFIINLTCNKTMEEAAREYSEFVNPTD
jgi:hypothetical protein